MTDVGHGTETHLGGLPTLSVGPLSDIPSALLGPVNLIFASGKKLAAALGADTRVGPQCVLPGEIPTHDVNVSRGGEIVQ